MASYTSINNAFSNANGESQYKSIIEASNKQGVSGTQTDRGTKIVNGTEGFDQNSFLKLLVAQMSNLDPTQDQDSTAYVTQMAQFAAMEQMYNLNSTMTTFAYQNLIGKGVTVDYADSNGNPYTGIVRGVSKESSGTYLAVEVSGTNGNEIKVFNVNKLISVLDSSDNTTSSNMLLNSAFLSASALADKNQNIVVYDTDSDGKTIYVKGKVQGAYIDNGDVKIRVETIKDDGTKGETKVYSYADIYRAGDLTEDDMNVKPETNNNITVDSATNGDAGAGSGIDGDEPKNSGNVNAEAQQAQEYQTGNVENNNLDSTIEKESKFLKSIVG